MKLPLISIVASGALAVFCESAPAQTTLKEAFKGQFLIGTAVNASQFTEKNTVEAAIVKAQFNAITPENVMKWEEIHPAPDRYRFEPADRYVEFGEKNGMFIVGHTLVWHSQVPKWVFSDDTGRPVDRETLLSRMRDHIHTVAGRYKGRVKGWDVVNEALADDGSLRDSPWREIIGDDYIEKAFQFAHEADPAAELYYNDYGIEVGAKRDGALALLKKLKADGIPITGVGIQEHVNFTWPSTQAVDEAIAAYGALGLKVMITEMDVDVLPSRTKSVNADVNRTEAADPALNPYPNGLPDKVQQALARRYASLFAVYLKHRNVVERVTIWGVSDEKSWLNNFPIKGRTNYPLLFDRADHPKPAFSAVIGAAKSASLPDLQNAQ